MEKLQKQISKLLLNKLFLSIVWVLSGPVEIIEILFQFSSKNTYIILAFLGRSSQFLIPKVDCCHPGKVS